MGNNYFSQLITVFHKRTRLSLKNSTAQKNPNIYRIDILPGGLLNDYKKSVSESFLKEAFDLPQTAASNMWPPRPKWSALKWENFMQKRRPDSPAVAHQVIAAAIAKAHILNPGLPLIAAGKSFGGRMSSHYFAEHPDSGVDAVISYGFPLHPAGKPATDRAEHLQRLHIPMLFLQGSRDALATWGLIHSVCNLLSLATLVRLERADHSFKAGKNSVLPDLVSETVKWVKKSSTR